jgi:2'-5' RNA ligase
VRLFVAIDVPATVRRDIYHACTAMRDAGLPFRWSAEPSYHVTLKFLGEVTPDATHGVCGALDSVAQTVPRFSVEVGRVGAFPTWKRARVLWMGVTGPPRLQHLFTAVEEALVRQGFERAVRPFEPHVTLGRVRSGKGHIRARTLRDLTSGLNYRASFPVQTVDLIHSHLSPQGARYTTVHRAELNGKGT